MKTDLFDEASGPHHHMQDLAKCGLPIGLDWDLAVARVAKSRLEGERLAVQFVVCDVRSLPFAPASIHTVISLSTLDHFATVGSIEQALNEIARALRQDGRLILTLDNPRNPEVFLRARLPSGLVQRLRADEFPLGKTLDARQAERVFQRNGLRPIRREYLIHGPRFAAIRVLNWLRAVGAHRLAGAAERTLEFMERLSGTPVRVFTGHYIGWWVRKAGEE